MVSIQERTWARSVLLEERSSSAAGYAWTVLFVVLLASVAASLNQFKVPPLVPILMAALGLGLGQAGMLMSIFAVAGLLLALPAGLIVQRLGPRRAGMIAVGLLVLGSAWGATAQSAAPLLASRGLEGAGMALIAVAGPAAIALWFPREQQGAPMGIWATWVPLGNVAMYNLAPALGTSMGWQAVWWAGAGFGLVALVLYWRLMRLPPSSPGDRGRQRRAPAGDRSPRLGAALANRSIWLLALEFACLNVALIGLYTFFPTYLAEVRGYSLVHAAFIVSLSTLVALGSAPLAGWLSDRIGSRRLVIAIPFLVVAGLLLLPFHLTGWPLYASTR